MRDISHIIGQELPSASKLSWSALLAFAVALVLLIIAVLPAEYGFDPTGLGKQMGLTALHQPDNATDTTAPSQTDKDITSINKRELLQKHAAKWRSDTMTLTLPAKQGTEVKALLDQGERLLFQWTTSGGSVLFDMHGNQVDAAEDDFSSFWLDNNATQAAGSFEAPFTGLHGWYWENEGDEPVIITLELEGYYKDIVQY